MVVAIYCRLSREDDDKLHENDESESIQNQKSMLVNYAIEKSCFVLFRRFKQTIGKENKSYYINFCLF